MGVRPKGFIEWRPHAATRKNVIEPVLAVLDEEAEALPLTVRQVFYALVGRYGYEKTEPAYQKLCDVLVRARRAQMIPFWKLRDDAGGGGGGGFDSPEDFWKTVAGDVEAYGRDRQNGQEAYLELWHEASGMGPQMWKIARDYSVPVYAAKRGGFVGVTMTYEFAKRACSRDVPTVLLHVGDHDPSGVSIFESIVVDASKFAVQMGGDPIEPVRVAITPEQAEAHNAPSAPPKPSDSRSAKWEGETWQAEALRAKELAVIVRKAIEDRLDMKRLRREVRREERERKEVGETFAELAGEIPSRREYEAAQQTEDF